MNPDIHLGKVVHNHYAILATFIQYHVLFNCQTAYAKKITNKKAGPFYETGLSFGGVPTESLQVNLALWGIEG